MIKVLENYLRETCQLTSSAWAVLADCEKDEWFVEAAYRLTKPRQTALVRFLGQPATSTWLDRALEGDEPSPLTLPEDPNWVRDACYVFSLEDESGIILVAAPALDARERRIWRLLRDLIPQQDEDDTNSNLHAQPPGRSGL